ncbi:MAG: hypothetical protein ABIH23_04610, partial [bacterium]
MLDLRYNATTRYYEAPLHLKANGGVFVIDDFGRQLVRPSDLLNRWIIPLEERIDYLTLHTGKKFAVPFEQLVIFATNLDPKALVDEAFLRRIRYKIFVGEPSLDAFRTIFDSECRKKGILYNRTDLDKAIQKHYTQLNRPLRACDPRDITDLILDYCAFNDAALCLSSEILDHTISSHFASLETISKR